MLEDPLHRLFSSWEVCFRVDIHIAFVKEIGNELVIKSMSGLWNNEKGNKKEWRHLSWNLIINKLYLCENLRKEFDGM